MSKDGHLEVIAELLFEFGVLRREDRKHLRMLLKFDPTDNIASHTARVAFIGMIIAMHEGLDMGKVVSMCLIHDFPEVRSGDHNWVAKRYVEVHEEEIVAEQFGAEGLEGLLVLAEEYGARETPEARAAKDADLIDELLLIKEHAHGGNLEAQHWLSDDGGKDRKADRLDMLHLPFSKKIMEVVYTMNPTDWWKGLWTSKNR